MSSKIICSCGEITTNRVFCDACMARIAPTDPTPAPKPPERFVSKHDCVIRGVYVAGVYHPVPETPIKAGDIVEFSEVGATVVGPAPKPPEWNFHRRHDISAEVVHDARKRLASYLDGVRVWGTPFVDSREVLGDWIASLSEEIAELKSLAELGQQIANYEVSNGGPTVAMAKALRERDEARAEAERLRQELALECLKRST